MNESANPHPRRVLLVDDEERLRGVIARYLRARGHDVTEAATASQARAVLTSQAIDVLLLDVNLGMETGWDVLSWLDSRGRLDIVTRAPCIVILSALPPPPARVEQFAPDAVLDKPCSVQAVARLVETSCSRPGTGLRTARPCAN